MSKRRNIFTKHLTLKRCLIAFGFLLGATVTAAAMIPGPQRALCPTCFGLTEIEDNIYADVDDVKMSNLFLNDLHASRKIVSDYMGGWSANPRIILCTIDEGPCDDLFGATQVRGIAWGYHLIRLNPKGLNITIMTHELAHTELHYRMGQLGMRNNIIPRWFNEGLAVHLSQDERFTYDYSDENLDLARSIISLHDWRREVNAETWPEIYGASAQLVRDIEDQIGTDGMRELIKRVTEGGEGFEIVLAKKTAR